MYLRRTDRPRIVTLSDGTLFSFADLPQPNTRWVARRKAAVVQAVQHGLATREEVITRYGLSEEELDSWAQAIATHGLAALKVTATQKYRAAHNRKES